MKKYLLGLLFSLFATVCYANCAVTSYPFNLTNGTVADASQVMANFNNILNGVNSNCAASGANTDITSLIGVTTGLAAAAGQVGELKTLSVDLNSNTVTFTNGSCNIGWVTDPPAVGGTVNFSTSGALPTNFAIQTNYYVISSAANVVTVASTYNGICISAGSAGSGTQTGINRAIFSTGAARDIGFINLTAGDWVCSGNVAYSASASTTVSALIGGLGTTANTVVTSGSNGSNYNFLQLTFTTSAAQNILTPVIDETISTATPLFLTGQANFATSTMLGGGYMRCRRVR